MPIRAIITHTADLPRRFQVAICLFALVTIGFFGAGIYAVWWGEEERGELQSDVVDVCVAVQGLRNDLVEVISAQEERGLRNARRLGLNVQELEEDYDEMYAKLGDRQCP